MQARFWGKSDAARKVPCSETTLLNYERRGLLAPERDSTGRRLYTEADIAIARQLRQQARNRYSNRL